MMRRSSVFLSSIAALCVLTGNAHAAVLDTQEWESFAGAPWSYTSGRPVIDCAVPASPSGGCALKFIYPAGTYATSFGGGRAERTILGSPTDLYIGAWMRYSSPFQFHQIGQKVNFFVLSGVGQCRNVAFGYSNGALAATPQICWADGTSTTNFLMNQASWGETAHLNEWHWYEQHVRLNTPGVRDGIAEMWIDDVLYVRHTNVPIRDVGDTAGWGLMQHTAEYGGGGSILNQDQYWWVDHTVLSTTRIGRPGTTPPGDTIAPRSPTLNFAN